MRAFNNIVKRGEVFAVKIATETLKGDFALEWRRAKPKLKPGVQDRKGDATFFFIPPQDLIFF